MVLKIALDELEATHATGTSHRRGSMRIAPPLFVEIDRNNTN